MNMNVHFSLRDAHCARAWRSYSDSSAYKRRNVNTPIEISVLT